MVMSKKGDYTSFITKISLTIILWVINTSGIIYAQSTSTYISKRGGICFRTDDDQPISNYLDYAALFNKYKQKFTFAINFGMDAMTVEYANKLREIQYSGHELLDHTPWHRTNFFYTKLSTDYYYNHPGVHRIDGNKVELNFADPDIAFAKRTGYVNIKKDTIISLSGIFSIFSKSDCYLYFPSLNKLVFIHETLGWLDDNTLRVTDVWSNSVDLGSHQNVQFYNFDYDNIHLTTDGIKALSEEQLRFADYYNLLRPYSWVQPGGYHPHLYKNEMKVALGDGLGYKSAGIFPDPGLKVFNEYNPNNDKQFGMNYGDFRDDNWTFDQCKSFIAHRIAKHHVVFGETHFTFSIGGLLGGWSGFLDRTEKLIQWCLVNNIPIHTYSEWADILYNQTPDPNENIFPPLNVDLDSNSISDGYDKAVEGALDKTDGYPSASDFCYSINKVGQFCSITDLGGIEKGYNNFEFWVKGEQGDTIDVIFLVGTDNYLHYKFPATSSVWKKYNLAQSLSRDTSLFIPEDVSVISWTIKCINYTSGDIKVSGFSLKPIQTKNYITVAPSYANIPSQAGQTNFKVYSNINWIVDENTGWFTVSIDSNKNGYQLKTNYQTNTSFLPRSGDITISGGGIIKTITVTQDAAPFVLAVSPSEQRIPYIADSIYFSVLYNSNWTVTHDADWFSVFPQSGYKDDTLIVVCSENTTDRVRVGSITIVGGGMSKTVLIIQDANNRPPENFELLQNYPNPFNPETKIKFRLPKQTHVSLKVFDILGSEVKTVLNEEKPLGNYEIEFDASDLASGIYFYRLQTNEVIYTKKMIHLK